jgi:hypothetical protein
MSRVEGRFWSLEIIRKTLGIFVDYVSCAPGSDDKRIGDGFDPEFAGLSRALSE